MYKESDKKKWVKKEDNSHYLYLVAKYNGLQYINPDAMEAYIIQEIRWYVDKETKEKNYCVLGLQKNCTSKWDFLEINENLRLQIRICDQEKNIQLINEDGRELDCKEQIEKHFGNHKHKEILRQGWDLFLLD